MTREIKRRKTFCSLSPFHGEKESQEFSSALVSPEQWKKKKPTTTQTHNFSRGQDKLGYGMIGHTLRDRLISFITQHC